MNIILFEQWDKLVAMFRNLAGSAATQKSQYDLNRIMPIDGKASLEDRAMNALALDGESVTLSLPDMIPGKARDFLVRIDATGECSVRFTGCDVFEGESGALDPPGDGETVVYFFTETKADVFMVARKAVGKLEIG